MLLFGRLFISTFGLTANRSPYVMTGMEKKWIETRWREPEDEERGDYGGFQKRYDGKDEETDRKRVLRQRSSFILVPSSKNTPTSNKFLKNI